jgi:hypothetical protein
MTGFVALEIQNEQSFQYKTFRDKFFYRPMHRYMLYMNVAVLPGNSFLYTLRHGVFLFSVLNGNKAKRYVQCLLSTLKQIYTEISN